MAADGLWRIGVPVELGGTGGTWRDLATAIAGIARGSDDLGFTLSLIAHAASSAPWSSTAPPGTTVTSCLPHARSHRRDRAHRTARRIRRRPDAYRRPPRG
ncbi:hypothetical protein AB6O49_00755 [Streptomyces sp. SBR177]